MVYLSRWSGAKFGFMHRLVLYNYPLYAMNRFHVCIIPLMFLYLLIGVTFLFVLFSIF